MGSAECRVQSAEAAPLCTPHSALGTALAGKPYGAGCDEAAVSLVLAAAIVFFCRNMDSPESAAVLLRRVLVSGVSIREAAVSAGVTPRRGRAMVREFRALMREFCEAEGVAVGRVLG